ncbi:MAG: radical SAM protein [Thermodesulfobacteriota bacterium]|nr:radical SAM protein [Thermodesulfobacteriota bacterium]
MQEPKRDESSIRHFIIPIFVPHMGCPHRCVFCNQRRVTGLSGSSVTQDLLEDTVKLYLQTKPNKESLKTQIAFYGGSFTGIEINIQEFLLCSGYRFIKDGRVDSMRISTRPDCIDPEIVSFLEAYRVETIELGVQSMVDRVLIQSNRGHTAYDTLKAVETISKKQLELGLQIMPGLPGDTPEFILNTVDKVIEMKPDFVRIYPTVVIRDTPLEELYLKGSFKPMTMDETIDICKEALLRFRKVDIPVARVGLQPTPELEKKDAVIAGPSHPSFRQLVESAIFFEMAERLIEKCPTLDKKPTFNVNPKEYSFFCGQKNRNVAKLKERYKLKEIDVISEMRVNKGALELLTGNTIYNIDSKELL